MRSMYAPLSGVRARRAWRMCFLLIPSNTTVYFQTSSQRLPSALTLECRALQKQPKNNPKTIQSETIDTRIKTIQSESERSNRIRSETIWRVEARFRNALK
jgi:hypothetical protein